MTEWLEDGWYECLAWAAAHPIALFGIVFLAASVAYLLLTKNPTQVESVRSSAKQALEIGAFLLFFAIALVCLGLVLIGGPYWLLDTVSTTGANLFLAFGTWPLGMLAAYMASKTAIVLVQVARGFPHARQRRDARLLREAEARKVSTGGGAAE